ncbi:MAG: NADH-quinone oxidoreductase subunit NuoG [Alphaproteobacteria bacterium]|nr:NADH-quinone oxidoreductase subunit NuoG [Alphaproteobacteria bacterium]
MAKVTVDGVEVEVPNGASVLQACEAASKEIPRFCYHERLSVAGNCRMCLVEVEKAPKPVASCAYPVMDGMKVFTDTPVVRNARRGVMEFLLINHPLDCPICDQGGECDLQDQAMAYGRDISRFSETKRAVKDKNIGPLVKTVMTRCIQCTRCIRFATEVAGVPDLGATGRGETMEVGTYVEKALGSELSGNLIDICPVGALTSRPYAFTARPWELTKTDSIDVLDATGVPIRIDTRGAEVLRIIPRQDDEVNEEWMGARGRFSFDGLKRRRLDRPWIRRDGKLVPATWPEALAEIAARFKGRLGAVVGDTTDAEAIFALRELMTRLGAALDCRQDGAAINATHRAHYAFNSGIAGIEEADRLLIIGSNPRLEAPVINARIRKAVLAGLRVAYVGPQMDLTYGAQRVELGTEFLAGATKPMVILGRGALARPDGAAILARAWELAAPTAEWNGFNLLHSFGGQVAALDLGFTGGDARAMAAGGLNALWLLGADALDIAPGVFVVYQGHHGDAGAARADVVLPGAAYTEKDGTWVNTEGRVQRAFAAVAPPGEAREDWKIIRAASAALNVTLPFDSIEALRAAHPLFNTLGLIRTPLPPAPPAAGAVSAEPFRLPITNYWQAEPIGRASPTMAECARGLTPALAAE